MNTLSHTERGLGRPLVWLHPFPFNSTIYLKQLAIEGVRHIAPDLAGFGKSAESSASSIDDHARDVIALLDRLQIDRAIFAGVSMGGYVALAIARLFPERVLGLVLADTKETPDSDEARGNRFKLIEQVDSKGAAALVEAMYKKMLAPASYDERKELAEMVEQSMLTAPPTGAADALRAMASRSDSTETLKQIGVPTLIVVGTEDVITPKSDAERMASIAPHAHLELLEGAGHLAMVEQPHAFNALISKFVAKLH
jgi:3-oxoadipate enol-lactonase